MVWSGVDLLLKKMKWPSETTLPPGLTAMALASRSNATLYVGDDATDERAFAVLQPWSGDLTVKVGTGDTSALHRVPDPEAVVELLELFVDVRRLHG